VSYTPDLDAYFARIGYRGPRAPTLETLHALSLHQVRAIPFESLDVLLGVGVSLDPQAVEDKLVHRRRGGYCFEQNSLLLHVLGALGYRVQPISGRVRWQRTRDYTPARTHVLLRVELGERPGDESWLVDCGVGSMSLTSALRLELDTEQATAHEPRRLVAEGSWDGLARRSPDGKLYHQVRLGAEWHDICELTLEDADDLVQDALLRAFRARAQTRDLGRMRGWLLTIVTNTFLDSLRRRKARPGEVELEVDVAAPAQEEDESPWARIDIEDVRAAVAELPEDVRETYRMFALEGRDYSGISSALGVPKATVGTRILRARKRLRGLLLRARDAHATR
jgi:RNA polymerase sigma factor (sigma-70 family)